jgi:outer membrane protein TolC
MAEAVQLAVRNNLSLETTRIATATKKRKTDLAWNALIPTVSLSGTTYHLNNAPTTTLPDGTTMSFPERQWGMSAALQFSLNLNVALFEGMKNTRLDFEGGILSFEKARAQLERDVRKAYYNILLLQENITVLKESRSTAEARVTTAEANYRAGTTPQLSLLQAQVALENLRPTIDQAENGLKLSIAQFALYLGLPYNSPLNLAPMSGNIQFKALNLDTLIAQATAQKPEIKELRQNILILDSGRKARRYQAYTPTLSLGLNFDPAYTGELGKDPLFGDDKWRQSQGMFRLTLAFGLDNYLPFSSVSQDIQGMTDNLRTLNVQLAQLIQGTEVEVYNTVLSLERIRTTAEAQSKTVELAQRSYELTNQSYRSGFSDLLEVQNAELELRRARVGILEQQYNYLMGLIDLEYSIGAPFGTLSTVQ